MSGIKRKRAHQNKESWFCQHGIQGFTACSHAFKTASGIQCTNYAEEFSKSQYIGEKHEIAVKGNNPFVFTKWDHHNGHYYGSKINAWRDLKNKAGSIAVHTAFFPQTDHVFHRLKQARSFSAGSDAFGSYHDPHKKQTCEQYQYKAYHIISGLKSKLFF